MIETREEHDRRMERAHTVHDHRRADIKTISAQILGFGADAIKAPALIAAAGVAVALEFYSANYSRLSSVPANLDTFNGVRFWLFASLLFVSIAPGAAYFSQICYTNGIVKEVWDYQRPFCHPTPRSRFWERFGDFWRFGAVAMVLCSIGCLVPGGLLFLSLVK